MKVYIAGPMRGYVDYNFAAFDAAAAMLESDGHEVVNPAQMDRDVGFDPKSTEVSNEFLRDALRRDLSAICDCDAIAMLPGWEHSGGANIEWSLAVHLSLRVIYLHETCRGSERADLAYPSCSPSAGLLGQKLAS
jgi:hypothetical protein